MQTLNGQIGRVRNELAAGEERVRYLQDQFTSEMAGTGGSRRYGYSTVARKDEAELRQAEADQKAARHKAEEDIGTWQEGLNNIQNNINQELEQFGKDLGKGFLARIRALSYLIEKEDPIRRADYSIIFLLILIELTPVLVKLLAPYGPYDGKLNLKNEAEVKEAEFRKDSMLRIVDQHYKTLTYAEIEVDNAFHEASISERGAKVRQAWQQWAISTVDGQGLTAEEFLELSKDRFFINRKP